MAPRKPKTSVDETVEVNLFPIEEGVCITKAELDEALRENMLRKTGSQPIEGQLDDLWRRLQG